MTKIIKNPKPAEPKTETEQTPQNLAKKSQDTATVSHNMEDSEETRPLFR